MSIVRGMTMTGLPVRQLGRTGLKVTVLGYGAMELRGAPRGRDVAPQNAQRVLNTVLDLGINYIDTSIDYGQSEEHIGRFLSQRRSDYYLATKCGCLVGDPPPRTDGQRFPHIFTRENIVSGVEQSLSRMKTDYIDVLQFHSGPSKETLEENDAIETVLDLKRQGKIRFIGMSSTLPNLAAHIAMGVFDIFQIPYSALQREHEEAIRLAATAAAGTVIRGGAAKGVPSSEKQLGTPWDIWQQAQLDDLLDGMDRMEFLLRFTISHPDLHTTIVGSMNMDHLKANVDAVQKGPLPPDLYAAAKTRLAAAGSVSQHD
jgi:aryl-alcohol dehydrogenase-like predicted oxidoreductase